MKAGIHPDYKSVEVTCSGCGYKINTASTSREIHIEICSNCHPFYTGKQKLNDTGGRIGRFKDKFGGVFS
ncbi:MAG: 50S ribosomal protein L31 [Gammaproteobacteria bacterium]|nr:50S ribosomal protein L31 [Gammaproteobacteria bacterium]